MKAQKVGKMAIFSVGAVLFSAHAGGGFATGNQANTSGKYILCRFRMDWYCECHNSYVAIDIDNARSHGDV